MKQFEVMIDNCQGSGLAAGSFFILKQAMYERALDFQLPTQLVSPKLAAHQKSIELEQKLLELETRLRRGAALLLEKLEARR